MQNALQTLTQLSDYARRLHQLDILAPRCVLVLVDSLMFEASVLAEDKQLRKAKLVSQEAEATLRYAMEASISGLGEVTWNDHLEALTGFQKELSNVSK